MRSELALYGQCATNSSFTNDQSTLFGNVQSSETQVTKIKDEKPCANVMLVVHQEIIVYGTIRMPVWKSVQLHSGMHVVDSKALEESKKHLTVN